MRKLSILGILFAVAFSSSAYALEAKNYNSSRSNKPSSSMDVHECERFPDICPDYQKAEAIRADNIDENDDSDERASYNNSRSNRANIRENESDIDDCKWDPAKCKQEAEAKANYNNTRSNRSTIRENESDIEYCKWYPDRCKQEAESIRTDDIDESDDSDERANYNNSRSNKSTIRDGDDIDENERANYNNSRSNRATIRENDSDIEYCKWYPDRCNQGVAEVQENDIEYCKWYPDRCKQDAESIRTDDIDESDDSDERAGYNNSRSNRANIRGDDVDEPNERFERASYNNSRSNRSTIRDGENQLLKRYAVRKVIVKKYEKAFRDKLDGRLEALTDEQLKKIDDRINTMLSNTKNNGSKNLARKQALLSALVALKNIFAEEMEKKSDDTMNLLEEVMQ